MNIEILKQIYLIRKMQLIILTALFAIAVCLQVFISIFQQPKVDMLKALWLKERAEDGTSGGRRDRKSIYTTALGDLQKFRERIYPKSHFAKFITELYDISSKNSLELLSISYKPNLLKEDNLLEYTLSLSVGGNYLQLKRFINDLSRCNNPVLIDAVSFTNQNATSGNVQLMVQITTYFRVEAQ